MPTLNTVLNATEIMAIEHIVNKLKAQGLQLYEVAPMPGTDGPSMVGIVPTKEDVDAVQKRMQVQAPEFLEPFEVVDGTPATDMAYKMAKTIVENSPHAHAVMTILVMLLEMSIGLCNQKAAEVELQREKDAGKPHH